MKNQTNVEGQNMPYIVGITLVATLGGLLFGYDTAVISGAIGSLRDYFELSDLEMGWAGSSALLGCMIGAAVAGLIADRFGRKPGLLLAAALFFISAVGTAIPETFTVFITFRIVGGIGVGIASMLSPMYIAEIAPAHLRGRLVSFNQLAIVSGILFVYFVNYYIALQGDVTWNTSIGWRWMFGSEAIPAGLFFLLVLAVPRSPRWLVLAGKEQEALKVFTKIMNPEYARRAVAEINASLHRDSLAPKVKLIGQGFGWVLFIGIMLSVFQQITGINVILYYAPEIFKQIGGGSTDAALLQTIVVGAVNMLFTFVAIATVDRFGRKPLMIIGSLGMGICITAVGVAAFMQNTGVWILLFILGYIASFALSLGPIVWVLLSEIFPNQIRAKALAIAVFAQWLANFVVSQTFPMMLGSDILNDNFHGAFPFWVYGSMCFVTIWFVWKYVPETKGRKLEDMEDLWRKKSDLVPETPEAPKVKI